MHSSIFDIANSIAITFVVWKWTRFITYLILVKAIAIVDVVVGDNYM